MPDGIVPDEGADNILLRILDPAGRGGSASWRLILWVNDITPNFATVRANLTDATFGGYSFVTLDPAVWTTPTVSDGCASSDYGTDSLVWYVTTGPVQTIYGYAFIDTGPNVIRFVQRFDPEDISEAPVGSRVVLLPRYTHTSAACGGSSSLAIGMRVPSVKRRK